MLSYAPQAREIAMRETPNRPRLLALDDEESLRDVLCEIGERAGFEALVTVTAVAFKEALTVHAPDVIMLDLRMPDMDGIEIMRFLANRNTRAGIVLVSGADLRTMSSAQRYGCSRGLNVVGTVQKPFVPYELLKQLQLANAATQRLTSQQRFRTHRVNVAPTPMSKWLRRTIMHERREVHSRRTGGAPAQIELTVCAKIGGQRP